ncbi:efflux transporter outer membrane subunit [Nitrosomonas sp.]|uniref:efflux transporter outer membrane subunit n=1 Tax=Nitrosomonas sp. TaxID=42353 RepID=UPI0025E358E0|nr:efflux transporter outer membrane subunit [Nitrosomonas sp.]MCC6915912.1 efflux transporter outer membrane subunit [Nitrosomonas sp.]
MLPHLAFSGRVLEIVTPAFFSLAEKAGFGCKRFFSTRSNQHQTSVLLLCSSLLITSCAMGPDYSRPQVEAAENYRLTQTEGQSIANLPWWELLRDEKLQSLINQALQENRNLKQATASVEELQARLGIARMDFVPNMEINGTAPVMGTLGGFSRAGFPTPYNYFGQTILNWELDIWGRIRRANEAARADLLAREENRRAVVLTLISSVAQSYFDLLQFDNQLDIARNTLSSWEESVVISRAQLDGGLIARQDLDQIEASRASAAVQVTELEKQIAQKENELSVLTGKHPAPVTRGFTLDGQFTLPEIPAGLPSELLQRRPDILQAEQNLKAATARIGAAKAARFPRITLTGFFGFSSPALSSLLQSDSKFGTGGFGIAGPLLNAQTLGFEQRAAEAQARQVLAQYEQTILIAFKEVEDALAAIRTANEQYKARQEQAEALTSALQLAELRYQNGITGYVDVLLAKRKLLDAETMLTTTRHLHLTSIIQLYKVLGGGWLAEAPGTPLPLSTGLLQNN